MATTAEQSPEFYDTTSCGFTAHPSFSEYPDRFKAHDWSRTALGPVHSWSSDLRCLLNLCMFDKRAAALWWGRDRLCIPNDAYHAVLGGRNSWALGKPVNEVWFDDDPATQRFRHAFDDIDSTGQPIFGANTCFYTERNGFVEELWATWTIIPILGQSGNAGYYNYCLETTQQVLSDRRMTLLLSLYQETVQARDKKELWESVLTCLGAYHADVPFTALFSRSSLKQDTYGGEPSQSPSINGSELPIIGGFPVASSRWILEGTLESTAKQLQMPLEMDWDQAIETLGPQFKRAIETSTVQKLDAANGTYPRPLQERSISRAWGDTCTSALILPFGQRQGASSGCFMLLGISPRCIYDEDYEKFIERLRSQLDQSLDSVYVTLNERYHSTKSAELASRKQALLTNKLNVSEADAKDQASRFRRMADQALIGMFEIGADGRLKYANNTWYEMTAYQRGDFPPFAWINIFHEEDRAWFAAKWARLTSGETLRFDIRLCKPYVSDDVIDGQQLKGQTWAAAAAYAEFDGDGNVKSVLGTVVDISRHKWVESFQERRTDEVLERKRQQEAFMDMISHETRNPLAAISLSIENIVETCERVLEDRSESILVSRDTLEIMLEGASTITTCVAHQKIIIDDVLTLSKMNSGILQNSPVIMHPLSQISQTLRMVDAEVQQADVKLDFAVHESYRQQGVDYVLLDPVRLRQILLNLLTNAIKFTKNEPSRHISVNIAASKERPSRSIEGIEYLHDTSHPPNPNESVDTVYLLITVQDTGRGIKESELNHLFQRFRQASPKTYVKYGGSGLGLFICKELARLQSGQIGVSSVFGQGSTFVFYVRTTKCSPATLDEPIASETIIHASASRLSDNPTKSTTSRDSTVHSAQQGHILLVEDNLVNQQVMTRQLQRAGYHVAIANHGQEALEYLSTTRVSREGGAELDLVLMDIEMPVMNGLACCQQIRELERHGKLFKRVPLIAVTANARVEQQKEVIEAGFDAIVTKPFQMKSLLAELEAYCLSGKELT